VEVLISSEKNLKVQAKEREEARIYFDHYRVKLAEMENK